MAEFKATDLNLVMGNSAEAFFVLDERGRVVFLNRGMESLTGVSRTDASAMDRLADEMLRPPVDLPPSTPRVARRPWGEGKSRKWLSITFIPLRDGAGGGVGVLGHATLCAESPEIPVAVDALAQERLARIREEQSVRFGFESVPARGAAMLRVLHQLKLAIASDTPVSFVGEIGTGKTALAQTLHFASERRRGNLAILDCRQSTSEQLRSALVGPAVISVEGAIQTEPADFGGLLHPSQSGTMILLGVGRLAVDLQELLVREMKDETPRWRLVATERETLESCLADGRLIASLYYLLSRFVISVPALRERPLELADHCQWILALRRPTTAKGEPVVGISPEAMQVLEGYDWPGNLVELEAVLLTAARRASKPMLSPRDLSRRLSKAAEREDISGETPQLPALDAMLDAIEQRMIELALRLFKGNKSKAAEALGISRPRLHKRAGKSFPTHQGLQQGPVEPEPQ